MSRNAPSSAEAIAEYSLPPALLLTVPEAAKVLRVGRTKVFELIKRGELQSVKIDSSRLIAPVFLEAYVAKLIAEAR